MNSTLRAIGMLDRAERDAIRAWMRTVDLCEGREAIEVSLASALYWFAADRHAGQWDGLYAAGCVLEYQPGPSERGPDPWWSDAGLLYAALCEARMSGA